MEDDDYAAETAVRTLLVHIGEDPMRDGLLDTPSRVRRAWKEMTRGSGVDPVAVLSRTFDVAHSEMVVVRAMPFWSLCEHHVVPFHGTVDVGYIPRGRIVGLSKFARAVEVLSRRLQVQERLTSQLADAIVKALDPVGVGVCVRARHMCMEMRGVRSPGETVTQALRGAMMDQLDVRSEFLSLVRAG